jgi:hypothetical protein
VAASRKSERWAIALIRALVVALALPLASSGALPFWAQLAGIEGPHVCHCSAEKHDCVCPKCNPDRDDLLVTSESLKGRCGDDEIAFGGKTLRAVLPSSSVLSPVVRRSPIDLAPTRSLDGLARPPPTPPPRPSSSAV